MQDSDAKIFHWQSGDWDGRTAPIIDKVIRTREQTQQIVDGCEHLQRWALFWIEVFGLECETGYNLFLFYA